MSGKSLPIRLLDAKVPEDWIDYNGHMTEFRYAQVFSDSCEVLLRKVGLHDDYVESGYSYFTVETHSQFFDEIAVNKAYYSTAQIIRADAKRLHAYYCMYAGDDSRLLATLEALYLHVELKSGKVVAAASEAIARLADLASRHADLETPDGLGRFVGKR